MNPIIANDSASGTINDQVFNGLVKYDKDIKLIGDLAERWAVSPDGKTITFHLRKGVKWHDGVEFTAEDCLFTYQKLMDPKVATPYSSSYMDVLKAEVVDRYTFRVTYKEPFSPALESWGMGMIPKHVLEGKDINTDPFNRHPIGTGPYRFKEWLAGQKIVLQANDDYFEGRPNIDEFIYRIITDSSTMFQELLSGGVDMMGLNPIQYLRKSETRRIRENYRKFRYPANVYTYMGYNLTSKLFTDKGGPAGPELRHRPPEHHRRHPPWSWQALHRPFLLCLLGVQPECKKLRLRPRARTQDAPRGRLEGYRR